MSTALIARHEWRRLAMQPFAWTLMAVVLAFMAWQFLLALQGFIDLAPKLGGLKDAPGVTELVAIPLLRSFSNLLLPLVPLVTMRAIAGERRAATLPLLLASGRSDLSIILGKYFGALGYVLLIVVLVVAMPLLLASGTALDLGRIAAGQHEDPRHRQDRRQRKPQEARRYVCDERVHEESIEMAHQIIIPDAPHLS